MESDNHAHGKFNIVNAIALFKTTKFAEQILRGCFSDVKKILNFVINQNQNLKFNHFDDFFEKWKHV